MAGVLFANLSEYITSNIGQESDLHNDNHGVKNSRFSTELF